MLRPTVMSTPLPPDDPSEMGVRPASARQPDAGPTSSESASTADAAEGAVDPAQLRDTADFKAVARVSTQAKLAAVVLSRVEAVLESSPGDVPADWSEQTNLETDSEAEVDSQSGTLTAVCGFRACYRLDRVDDEQEEGLPLDNQRPAVRIAARFALAYELEDPGRLEAGDAEQFARVNSMLHAWPYWRELAQSMSVRMGIPALLIQTFKIPSPYDPDAGRPKADARQPSQEAPSGPGDQDSGDA